MTKRACAIPVFIIADKHFMIAAKIVETFFDCAYNPNIKNSFNWQSDLKRMLAEVIKIDCQVKCNTIREKIFEAPRRESGN